MRQPRLCGSAGRWPSSEDVRGQAQQRQWLSGGRQDGGGGHGQDPPLPGDGHRPHLVLSEEVTEAGAKDLPGEVGDPADHLEPDAREGGRGQ